MPVLEQVQEMLLALQLVPQLPALLQEEAREMPLKFQLAPQLQALPLEPVWEIPLALMRLALPVEVVRDLPLESQLAPLPSALLLEEEPEMPLALPLLVFVLNCLRVTMLLVTLPEGVWGLQMVLAQPVLRKLCVPHLPGVAQGSQVPPLAPALSLPSAPHPFLHRPAHSCHLPPRP